jgi:hypothetical protein
MDETASAAETGNEAAGEQSLRLWLLMRADRRLLTAVVLAGSMLAFLAITQLDPGAVRTIARTQNGLKWLFSPFIGAIITGTAIVVTINQLVLAQELGAVGDQRERMQEAMQFRNDVEEAVGVETSPPEPSRFLAALLIGIQAQAADLQDVTAAGSDTERAEQVTEFVAELRASTQPIAAALEAARFGTFEVVWHALRFDYSAQIHRARALRNEHESGLTDEEVEAFEDLVDALAFYGPAREHIKTLYFQWELISLSRALLYVSIPALVVVGTMLTTVDATSVPGQTLGVDNLALLTSVGFTVGIAPFVVFIVSILRIVTVAKRTLAIGPFSLQNTQRGEQED